MPNVSKFGAQTDNSVVQGTVTDRAMVIPDIPPQGLMSVGPRVTPHFVKPSLWSALTTYHFFDAVHDAAGASYVAIKPEVPAGTELTDEDYWFLWADPNSQFADLSELVKTYNGRIEQNKQDITTKAPINHASEDTTYGVGNEVNYGHAKLAVDSTPITSDANSGIAATPAYVSKVIKDNNNTNVPFKNPILVAIGDSWVNPTTSWYQEAQWPKIAANLLGCSGFQNLSVEGAGGGFTNLSTLESERYSSFNAQISYAENHFTESQKINTKYVVVIGGTNDFGYGNIDLQTWVSNVSTVLKHASNVFPNAKILHLIDNSLCQDNPTETESSNNSQRWNKLTSFIPQIYNTYLPYTRLDLIPSMLTNNYYYNDWLHPNKAGCTMIGYLVATLLNGNLCAFNRQPAFINSFEDAAATDNQKATICANHDGTVDITFNSVTINDTEYTSIEPNVKLKTILGYVNTLNPVVCTAYENGKTIAIKYKINKDAILIRNTDTIDSGTKTVKLIMKFRLG